MLIEDSNNIKKSSNAIKNNSEKSYMSKNDNVLSKEVLYAKIKKTYDHI